jgi:hypothetical protein
VTGPQPGRRAGQPAARRPAVPAPGGDAGQVTAFVVVVMVALLAVAGLVYDGGEALAAKTAAIDIAQEAARAGAEQVNLAVLRAAGQVTLDAPAARAAALAYVAATGTGDTAAVTVARTAVTVAVSRSQPAVFLSAIGIGTLRVTGSATATAESGVTGPGAAGPARLPAARGRRAAGNR